MKTLRLTLTKKWFDMIASGEKTEEYREIKPYWVTRLAVCEGVNDPPHTGFYCKKANCFNCITSGAEFHAISFERVEFTNGYGKDRPRITLKCAGITLDTGKSEWGAVGGEEYFVIKLGKELSRENF